MLGTYINPDEIEKKIRHSKKLNFRKYDINVKADEIRKFFENSTFLNNIGLKNSAEKLIYKKNQIDFENVELNSYFASVVSDFIRQI